MNPSGQHGDRLGELIAAGDFQLDGFDEDVVVEFLLHGSIGPCFHYGDPNTAIANVQQLFAARLGSGSEPQRPLEQLQRGVVRQVLSPGLGWQGLITAGLALSYG